MTAQFTLRANCKAGPETVYDILADLDSHLEWNGKRQAKNFRLLSLVAAPGPAREGAIFESTGNIPYSRRTWRDTSTVTAAARPNLFEFRTVGRVDFEDGTQMVATLLHTYKVAPDAGGSRVSYTMQLEGLTHGMWRLSLPILRTFIWKIGIPSATRPGFKNLLQMAEASADLRRRAMTAAVS